MLHYDSRSRNLAARQSLRGRLLRKHSTRSFDFSPAFTWTTLFPHHFLHVLAPCMCSKPFRGKAQVHQLPGQGDRKAGTAHRAEGQDRAISAGHSCVRTSYAVWLLGAWITRPRRDFHLAEGGKGRFHRAPRRSSIVFLCLGIGGAPHQFPCLKSLKLPLSQCSSPAATGIKPAPTNVC